MDEREEELKEKFKTDSYKNKLLATLRAEIYSQIKFKDENIKQILNNIDNYYITEEDAEEETEE